MDPLLIREAVYEACGALPGSLRDWWAHERGKMIAHTRGFLFMKLARRGYNRDLCVNRGVTKQVVAELARVVGA